MSKFLTTIPVDVESVIASLPKNHYLHCIRNGHDKKSIVIEWEHDEWRTPYTVPVEVSPAALAGQEPLPTTIKQAAGFQRVPNAALEPVAAKRKKSAQ